MRMHPHAPVRREFKSPSDTQTGAISPKQASLEHAQPGRQQAAEPPGLSPRGGGHDRPGRSSYAEPGQQCSALIFAGSQVQHCSHVGVRSLAD
jgi:hypothetical protein